MASPSPQHPPIGPDTRWLRAAGYLIDLLPPIPILLFGVVPIAGPMIVCVFLTPYWLLRDVFGGSLGKRVVGLRVVSADGRFANRRSLVLRNVPLALAPALLFIPLIGPFLAAPTGFVVVVVEAIGVLSQAQRIGDRLAGTMVVAR
jgi:uncharacterized RDD family membrane protein YckC